MRWLTPAEFSERKIPKNNTAEAKSLETNNTSASLEGTVAFY
jgi:hypothetical protein